MVFSPVFVFSCIRELNPDEQMLFHSSRHEENKPWMGMLRKKAAGREGTKFREMGGSRDLSHGTLVKSFQLSFSTERLVVEFFLPTVPC